MRTATTTNVQCYGMLHNVTFTPPPPPRFSVAGLGDPIGRKRHNCQKWRKKCNKMQQIAALRGGVRKWIS
jgi:hypothetical protein